MNAKLRAAMSVALLAGAFAGGAYANEPAEPNARAEAQAESRTKASDAQIYASPSQVRLVQEKLRAQGRKPGGVDGVWGELTVAEVRDFQKANGLAPTGQLDTSLLSALEIGDILEGQESSTGFLDGLLRSDTANAQAETQSPGRGTPIFVSPVHIAQIQHLLREQGHYSGEVDGAWGAETAQAANKYRQAKGLEANDGVDIALLKALDQQRAEVPQIAAAATSRTEGAPLQAGPVAVRALQRELSEEGHNAGDVDGEWGENTRQALRDFQREQDLEATGTLTLPTLAALGIDLTERSGRSAIEGRSRSAGESLSEDEQDAVATSDPDTDRD
ncbi:MAG: peptidoglycan-binding domain-containing protein [Steroidobacter sp.]